MELKATNPTTSDAEIEGLDSKNETQGMEEFENGVKQEQERVASQNAVDNIIDFYNKHQKICDDSYEYYKIFEEKMNSFVSTPQRVTKKLFVDEMRKNKLKILVITANPIEKGVFLRWLQGKAENEYGPGFILDSYLVGKTALVVCNISGKTIVHIQTKDTGEEYTRVAINEATKLFKPSYIVMLGICYGLEMDRYQIGSVFVSESITTFRLNFRDDEKSDETIYQAQNEYIKAPDEDLVDTIRSKLSLTQIHSVLSETAKPTIAKTAVGKILSSNSLMSSKKVKNAVMEQYAQNKPHPLGGEMEGAGILKSSLVQERKFRKWMIIKSICDWGEKKNKLSEDKEKNEKMKDSIQAFAMTNTCGTFEAILNELE